MSCCPPGSWPSLAPKDQYEEKGTVDQLEDGFGIYRAGSGEKCIIWNYHIFGFHGGLGRQWVDMLAEQGYLVLMPDYFRRGRFQDPTKPGAMEFIKEVTQWENLKRDWEDKIRPYAEKHGAKEFAAVGTCWGSYLTLKLSSYPCFKVGVSLHPAHTNMCQMLQEQEEQLLSGAKGTPQLFAPAGNDHENTKEGGLAQSVLGGEGVKIVEFGEMKHGWTVRGDVQEEAVKRDVVRAKALVVEFLKENWK